MKRPVRVVVLLAAMSCIVSCGTLGEKSEDTFVPVGSIDEVWNNIDQSKPAGWQANQEFREAMGVALTAAVIRKIEGATITGCGAGFPDEGPDNLFDDDIGSKFCIKTTSDVWIQVQYAGSTKRKVTAYAITAANDFASRDPKTWSLLGSKDGKKWKTLDSRKNEDFAHRFQRREFAVAKPGSYNYYKLAVAANHGDEIHQMSELELLTEEDRENRAKKVATPELGFRPLFRDDLKAAIYPKKLWQIEEGLLSIKPKGTGKGDIWTGKRYRNFLLELDFKCEEDTNSGVFIRCGNVDQWLHTAIELQIMQRDSENKTHVCGAIFDCLAPKKQVIKKAGKWNHYRILVRDNKIVVALNGEQVINMDLNKWTEAGKNPDGTKNKFKTAYKDMPGEGHVGLQYHGHPVWFRNMKIKELP